MPLKHGKSKTIRSKNIQELIHSYKEKGKIGNIKPRNFKHAIAIASAIAYRIQRKARQHRRQKK